MSKEKRNVLSTAIGVAAALTFMLVGLLIPKTLLAKQEREYFGKRTVSGVPVVTEALITPHPTEPPSGMHGLTGENVLTAWEALNLSAIIGGFYLREPYEYELSMEEAEKMAYKELSALADVHAIPVPFTESFRLRSAMLSGMTYKSTGDSSWPSGVWSLVFEDENGEETCRIVCDSQTGLVWSIAFPSGFYALSGADRWSMLLHYAEYFGISTDELQNIYTDGSGYTAEIGGAEFNLGQRGAGFELTIMDHGGAAIIEGEQSCPTPCPTEMPTSPPAATPTGRPK